MFGVKAQRVFLAACLCFTVAAGAGPYTEAGVNGYIGDDRRHADPCDSDARLNPIFRGWATAVESYEPTPQYINPWWKDPTKALGAATGDKYDIVSLGDLEQEDISEGVPPGQITLSFSETIRDQNGYDFVVFENGFRFADNEYFCELGYVEVSSNGVNFARFPAVSLTGGRVGVSGTVDITNIYNLAGKHPNAYGVCTGTGFDLSELKDDPMVQSGIVDINDIAYVRIVDIPGSGDFLDEATWYIDPCSWPNWDYYDANHPVYDAWVTSGSGGFDLEAIGVLEEQEYSADIDLDGMVDAYDLLLFSSAWLSHFGEYNWTGRCDLSEPKDLVIDFSDFVMFADQWQKVESWRGQ